MKASDPSKLRRRHPACEEIERLMPEPASAESQWLAHLLRCKVCSDTALALLRIGEPSRRRKSFDYGAVLSRVEARTNDMLAWLSAVGGRSEELAEDLSRQPDEEARRRRVRELAQIEPTMTAVSLLGMSTQLVRTEPARAAVLAELSIVAAEAITEAPSMKSGLLGRAQLVLGEALRRARRFPEAEEAFARAAAHLGATADEASLALQRHLLSRPRRV